jgi:integrase
MEPIDPTPAALLDLLPEWELALRAEDKTPGTIEAYLGGARRYLDWCTSADAVPMRRTSLQTWMAHLLDTGNTPGTVLARKQSVKRFGAWLLATGQLPGDPFLGVKGPAQRRPIVLPLSTDELRALIATCTNPVHRPDEALHHRRDEALIRLMLETGIRAGEVVALDVADLDLDVNRITVRRGKGGNLRTIPVGPSTIAAIRAYLPERDRHPAADGPRLWLGERGASFGYDGLNQALRRRAQHAGIDGFHLHRLRHTAAHRWLAAGGSETGLMAMAGWSRTDMLVRYTRATAADRAAAEALRLDLGNL